MAKITSLTQDLYRFMLRNRTSEDRLLSELRRETEERVGALAGMMISEEQGLFLRILVAAVGAKQVVEVGTFTGYSAACMAAAMPADGRLLCCDVSKEWTSIGAPYWKRGGLADRIDLRIAPALDTLRELPGEPPVDFAFVDADKHNYVAYFEALLPKLRTNGLLAFDNVMWHNWMMDAANQDAETVGIREFNDHVLGDPRIETVMLHVGDGLTLIRKL
ncbi:MAG: class I SAM-dependent methyltransferase [Bryobacterales bacterium]|nr:class I SAM-dependent methyltransferase [Bryobacterales bacterium]